MYEFEIKYLLPNEEGHVDMFCAVMGTSCEKNNLMVPVPLCGVGFAGVESM